MWLLTRWLAPVLALTFVLPAIAIAGDKEETEETPSKEMELKACGAKESEVNFKAGTDKSQHPTPEAPADKALIYVLRPSMMGNKIQTKLAADGEWKGVNRGDNYFYFTVVPGEHFFCSMAENRSVLKLNVETGKTYFLQQHVRMGVMKARNKLDVMSDKEGKEKLASAHLSTWETK